MVGFVGMIGQAGVSIRFKPVTPHTHDRRAGVKELGCGFNADLKGFLDHLVTENFLVFTMFHNVIIFVRTHKSLGLLSNLAGFLGTIMCPFLFNRADYS